MKNKLISLLFLSVSLMGAQTFEVVAIHPNVTNQTPLVRSQPGGMFVATNTTLRTLIRVAYGIPVPRIVGPDWMTSLHFDISAKGVPEDTTLAIMAPKLKAMLADRFGLVAHEETVEATAIVLSGGHLVASSGGDTILHMSRNAMQAKSTTMAALVLGLSDVTGDLYVDETGFKDRLDVDIVWSRNPDELAAAANLPASLNTVLHEKMGLEVHSKKIPVTKLVIDKANKNPTEN